MTAAAVVRDYYAAVRAGRPLSRFFADGEPTVKLGISERLVGLDAVREGLAAQTASTADWAVESRSLSVTARSCHAWFADEVRLAWTDVDDGVRHDYDTRWTGTLEARTADGGTGAGVAPPGADGDGGDPERVDGRERRGDPGAGPEPEPDAGAGADGTPGWRFVTMHVSTADDLDG